MLCTPDVSGLIPEGTQKNNSVSGFHGAKKSVSLMWVTIKITEKKKKKIKILIEPETSSVESKCDTH